MVVVLVVDVVLLVVLEVVLLVVDVVVGGQGVQSSLVTQVVPHGYMEAGSFDGSFIGGSAAHTVISLKGEIVREV